MSDTTNDEPVQPAEINADLIAKLRTTLPALLDTIEEQWGGLQAYENHCKRLGEALSRAQARVAELEERLAREKLMRTVALACGQEGV